MSVSNQSTTEVITQEQLEAANFWVKTRLEGIANT